MKSYIDEEIVAGNFQDVESEDSHVKYDIQCRCWEDMSSFSFEKNEEQTSLNKQRIVLVKGLACKQWLPRIALDISYTGILDITVCSYNLQHWVAYVA